MRVSPVGYYADSVEECLELAKLSAECSHNHPEGIKGAQAIALCIYYALYSEVPRVQILKVLRAEYPSYATKKLDDIRPDYKFTSTCEGSVPVAILAFLESHDYEECLKLAISMGGDSDTIAAMAGSIAYAYYEKMDTALEEHVIETLPEDALKLCRKFDRLVNEK